MSPENQPYNPISQELKKAGENPNDSPELESREKPPSFPEIIKQSTIASLLDEEKRINKDLNSGNINEGTAQAQLKELNTLCFKLTNESLEDLFLETKLSLTESYETQITLMNEFNIIKEGKINPELVDPRLRKEDLTEFPVPTLEQIREEILSNREQVEHFISMGLTRMILEPIACELGTDDEDKIDTGGNHQYTGLLSIVADKLRKAHDDDELLQSDGEKVTVFDSNQPIYFFSSNPDNNNLITLDQGENPQEKPKVTIVQDQIKFKGWRIKFVPDTNLLPETINLKDKDEKHFTISDKDKAGSYQDNLIKAGLSGTTPIVEMILLLYSLSSKEKKVTNDWYNVERNDQGQLIKRNDHAVYMTGVSNSSGVPFCRWSRGVGLLEFNLRDSDLADVNVVGRPVGELNS